MAKTIVGELVDLYVKFGGDPSDLTGKETISEMLDAITKVYQGGGGSDLPEVTSADDGKVLTVVEDAESGTVKWDKADAPSDIFIVNYSYDEMEIKWVCDKSYTEILAAYNSGKAVIAIAENHNEIWHLTCNYQYGSTLYFSGVYGFYEDGQWGCKVTFLNHTTSETITQQEKFITITN